jgi:NAD(P)-dependent dehydrogenase (short-subunit alcohol dehydrogenase family)
MSEHADASLPAAKGLRCVVTGAASGIGAAIAARLQQEGKRVVGIDRQPIANSHVAPITADLRQADAISAAIVAARQQLSGIDVLVCAAGISRITPFTATSREDIADQLAINLVAPMLLSQAVLPDMVARGSGCIVYIVSELAEVSQPGYAAYCASKGGLKSFMRALALEYAPQGIRINAVSPGPIDTPMLQREFSLAPDPDAEQTAAVASMPIGRLGRSDEIAEVVSWLVSSAPTLLQGATLLADGGKTLA